ncbi:MAG TPA: tetratricopeptide repeat protein [Candidatus Solibacter sp.]|nr:tetratricopeptide repeat protein [Candidatus Solibacter sp.]
MDAAAPQSRVRIACLVLAVVTLVLYIPITHHPFVNYDDDRYVTDNPHVRQGLTAATVKWALTSTEQANWHPLTWMSHALDCSLYRLNAGGHHFNSLLWHVVNVLLLFLFLVRFTERFGPSFFVAALFALHPIEVESVAWVAERKNVLCTTFFLLALLAYGWYARKPDWKRYLAMLLLFAMGLAAKPMVITLPFVLLLLDYWPLRRVGDSDSGIHPASWPKLILEKVPLLVLSAGSALVTMGAQQSGGAVRSVTEFSFVLRLENAICSYAMYLWKMVWPLRLAPLYPHPGSSLAAWQVAMAVLVLITITAFVIRFRSHRCLLVGWLWFLGTLVPVIGLVQVGEAAMADRYAYIPLIGIFIMIAFGVAESVEASKFRRQLAITGGMILLALAVLSWRQIGYWRNSVELWTHALAVTQNNFVAEDNLGGALILEDKEEEAHAHFEAAARINPHDPMSRSNLGAYFQTHNRLREAIAEYEGVVSLTSDPALLAQCYANMGAAHRTLGEDEQAHLDFAQALRLNPNQFNAWIGMGILAEKRGELGEAITDLSHSVKLQPTAEAYFHLGSLLAQMGHAPEAIGAYREALKLSPNLAEAQQAIDALRQPRK